MTPTRPVLRWHGGKWRLAPWILQQMPSHRVYVEPFGGAASVLLRKSRVHAEVYNDLDKEVVGLFRVLQQDDLSTRLVEKLRLTPFAREEFALSYVASDDPVEAARRLIIRSYMGLGSNAHATDGSGRLQTGFRSNSSRSGTTPAGDWRNYPPALAAIVERWRGVIIENRDACIVMAQHDGPDTVHYVDPPYLPETRSKANAYCNKHLYRHELTAADHAELLAFLCELKGMVMLSGYPAPLYDEALADWSRVEISAMADGARERTEVLWLNPACVDALRRRAAGEGSPLFRHFEAAE